jgi:GNAT superfamily N-acetyltransferase
MRPITIRPARATDAEPLAALSAHLGYAADAAELPARLAKVQGQGDEVLVAEDAEGRVVGYSALHLMRVFHVPRPLGYITAFVTDPALRRSGVGRRLLEASTDWARAQGCLRLVLTSAEHRSDAHAFYEACGFPRTGRRFGKDL